jgi:gluconate kinase
MLILVMGVRGAGKTPLAQELSRVLGYDFLDSSDLYSDEIKSSFVNGQAISDEVRAKFLQDVYLKCHDALFGERNMVISCPALRESDRRFILREGGKYEIILLEGTTAQDNLSYQLGELEIPSSAIRIKAGLPLAVQLDIAINNLRLEGKFAA